MTVLLHLYRGVSGLCEPLVPFVLKARLSRGKERRERMSERLGLASRPRPPGRIVWMHAASVGESRILLDLFSRMRTRHRDILAVITTQTLTSADMIEREGDPAIIHQMAPVDTPRAGRAFLDHWRPEAVVFAEGELWPGLLTEVKRRRIPAALVNARMTQKSLSSWRKRPQTARALLSAFSFIGAADRATADGIEALTGQPAGTIGNLKRAQPAPRVDVDLLNRLRRISGPSPFVLAASTHDGEEALAIEAFRMLRRQHPAVRMIIAPRHPERCGAVAWLLSAAGLSYLRRSHETRWETLGQDVILADTMGEMGLWYTLSSAVFLGGGVPEGIGGHNPLEPARLGRRVVSGPHVHNFAEIFEALAQTGAVTFAKTAAEVCAFWEAQLSDQTPEIRLDAYFREADAPMMTSLEAVCSLIEKGRSDA